uniref:Uncharacterized protein n=1 Tax=Tetranychus urticae TaxID=32264 RepID=T1KQ82_TETUR
MCWTEMYSSSITTGARSIIVTVGKSVDTIDVNINIATLLASCLNC